MRFFLTISAVVGILYPLAFPALSMATACGIALTSAVIGTAAIFLD